MPSFTLTPDEARIFRPLPGHALLRVLPLSDADLKDTPDSLIYKPESAAQDELEAQAVRRGELICITWTNPGTGSKELDRIFHSETEYASTLARHSKSGVHNHQRIKWGFNPDCIVWYLGRANESDNQYVIVKVLQIVALETPELLISLTGGKIQQAIDTIRAL